MPDVKGSSLTRLSTVPDNADIVIIVPDGSGGFLDYKCSKEDLIKEVVSNIIDLQSATESGSELTARYPAKVATFTHAVVANTKINSIDVIFVSGTLTLKIGTSVSGDEIFLESQVLTNFVVPVNKIHSSSITYYFTLSGTGSATFIVNYKLNAI